MKTKIQHVKDAIEQQAEEIKIAMVRQSWDENVETIANLLRELEAARKVADAASAVEIVWRAMDRLNEATIIKGDAYRHALDILYQAEAEAEDSRDNAVREYRACAESLEERQGDGLEQTPPMLVFRDTKPDAEAESGKENKANDERRD